MLRGLKRLNRYDKKILRILKLGGKFTSFSQIGFSRKTSAGFRFPIHALKIGTEKRNQRTSGWDCCRGSWFRDDRHFDPS